MDRLLSSEEGTRRGRHLSSLAGNGPAKSTSVRADRQGSQCPSTRKLGTEWAPAALTGQEPQRIGRAAALGPHWGRETAVTHGQPRCLADNENRSSTAVSAVMGPLVRIWHARGQVSRR